MKISNDAIEELKRIRNALDDMYDKLNIKSLNTYEKDLIFCKTK